MPQPVIDAITDHIELEARIGGYEAAAAQQQMLDGVYTSVARLLGAAPQEIALMENARAAYRDKPPRQTSAPQFGPAPQSNIAALEPRTCSFAEAAKSR